MLNSPKLPFARREPDRRGHSWAAQTLLLNVFHVAVFALCATEIVAKAFTRIGQNQEKIPTPWMGVSLLWCSVWLVAGPALVRLWGGKWRVFVGEFGEISKDGDDEVAVLNETYRALKKLRPFIILLPSVLMLLAFRYGNNFFATVLGVGQEEFVLSLISSWMSKFVWISILMLGCFSAGWGVWCAVVTLVVAAQISRREVVFSPFAGVASKSTSVLMRFCFASAMIFCGGGTLVVPAFTAAASQTDGAGPWLLGGLIFLVVGTAGALLAVPTVLISRQLERERQAYLDKLSKEIDLLADCLMAGTPGQNSADFARLDSLLHLRAHVMQHLNSDASLRLVRLIPITVLPPVSTALTSWLGLLQSSGRS